MSEKFEEYGDLMSTGYDTREPVKPEDEFFHSVYISGKTRKNDSGITEHVEKLQIRGVEYNLDEINMVITHTKGLLSKIHREATGKEKIECFSYQEGPPPWKGTSGNQCGTNSAERAANDFCNSCRAQIIVGGIFCDNKGQPILRENDKKPIFIFIRGKGTKYSNIANYLNECSKREDLEPIFTPSTSESIRFEKAVVNNKRFVTKISVGETSSQFGIKKVFALETGEPIENASVMATLKIAKKTQDKFNDKLDWSKKRNSYGNVQGYTETSKSEGLTQVPDSTSSSSKVKSPVKEEKPKDTQFSFDDLDF